MKLTKTYQRIRLTSSLVISYKIRNCAEISAGHTQDCQGQDVSNLGNEKHEKCEYSILNIHFEFMQFICIEFVADAFKCMLPFKFSLNEIKNIFPSFVKKMIS